VASFPNVQLSMVILPVQLQPRKPAANRTKPKAAGLKPKKVRFGSFVSLSEYMSSSPLPFRRKIPFEKLLSRFFGKFLYACIGSAIAPSAWSISAMESH
jgi:hypothetical protein